MGLSDTDNKSSAQTSAHAPDWEAVFEESDLGLIPLVARAHSPDALRKIASLVAETLLVREEDAAELGSLKTELLAAVPDDAAPDDLPVIIDKLTVILRRIKEDRARRAGELGDETRRSKRRGERRKKKGAPEARAKQPTNKRKRKPKPLPKRTSDISSSPFVLVLALIAIAVAGVAAYLVVRDPGSKRIDERVSVFIDEMRAAAAGGKNRVHVFGGTLAVGNAGGNDFVSATQVPPDVCASAGWVFANRGTIVINTVMPPRISPQVLRQLCEREPHGATLTWFPKG